MIVVLASGEGTNFSAIVDSGIKVDMLLTNNPRANVISRAIDNDVPYEHILHMDLDDYIPKDVDLIVLAGYNRVLNTSTCNKFRGKIINIHPSLLPAFAGTLHAIEESYNYGVKLMGVTIHYVTAEVDAGEIIEQAAIPVVGTLEEMEEKIHKLEHELLPKIIRKLLYAN